MKIAHNSTLSLSQLNFLNELVHLPFLGHSIIRFRGIKMRILRWSAKNIESGQTARTCRLAWLYIGGKKLVTFASCRIRVIKILDQENEIKVVQILTGVVSIQLQVPTV